jgi:secreted PhoX family phosphatase
LVDAVPLTAMGRFNHEAAVVDPATGIVYLTEDRDDGLLYRFLPNEPGKLARGGRLQALAARGLKDSRNWKDRPISPGRSREVRWVDLDQVDSPEDNLRRQGAAKGATLFARGEGIHMGVGDAGSELFFCCTSGGAAGYGQVFRLVPGEDRLELFFESTSKNQFNYGDNLTVAPSGHLIVCEDAYTKLIDNHLRGITPDGRAYPLARLRVQTEPAGACFSPDGKVLFVNAYSPALTLAITGPWAG